MLSVDLSAWEPTPDEVHFQWLRDGQEVDGAEAQTYVVQSTDAGSEMSVRVRGRKSGWASETVTASAVGVADALTGEGSLSFDRLSIEGAPGQGVAIQPAEVPDEGWESLTTYLNLGVVVGTPFELTVDGTLPDDGVRITKTYPVPLPEGLDATLGFLDEDTREWALVESEISPDRLSVSAVVSHLSTWTDFVSGARGARDSFVTGASAAGARMVDSATSTAQAIRDSAVSAITTGAEALYYTAASIFETRVDPPQCSLPAPSWAQGLVVPPWAANAPTHWCVGADPAHPDQLLVKARVNRGYAMPWNTTANPARVHNSSFDSSTIHDGLAALADISPFVASAASTILAGGSTVLGGEELAVSVTESEVRSSGGLTVQLQYPTAAEVLFAVLVRVMSEAGLERADGALAASVAIGNCTASLSGVSSITDVLSALITCVGSAKDQIQRQSISMLESIHPGQSGIDAKVTRAVGKITVTLALLGPIITAASYAADSLADPQGAQNRATADVAPGQFPSYLYECTVRVDSLQLATTQFSVQPQFYLPATVGAGDTFATGPQAQISITTSDLLRSGLVQLFGDEVTHGVLLEGGVRVSTSAGDELQPLIGWLINDHRIPGAGEGPYEINVSGQGPFFDVPMGAHGRVEVRLSEELVFEQALLPHSGGAPLHMRADCKSSTSPLLGTLTVLRP